ncbi:MAG: GAF domain-containing protein, partial [Acidobacteriota bacterium]
MIRGVNASLDPERVAEALVARVSAWVPADAWLVLAVDGGGRTRTMAATALAPPLDSAAHAIAAWVIRNGEVFSTASVAQDRRVADDARVASVGFPLECRGRTIGALVAVDRAPSRSAPRFAPATMTALAAALEP